MEVTANHKMYTRLRKWNKDTNKYDHKQFELVEAKDVIENSKFLGSVDWDGEVPEKLFCS